VLLVGATGLVMLSLALPYEGSVDVPALIVTAGSMCVVGLLCLALARHIPIWMAHGLLAATMALTGLLIYESGVAAGQYGAVFVWGTLIAAYFFTRRAAIAHLLWLLGVYAVTLVAVSESAGYSSLTRWLFSAVSLSVVMLLTSSLVARRERADMRARRFFDLSRDMLCTANTEGYFVELNAAWESCLGYTPEELRAKPFIGRVHPEDRERTQAEAASLFNGEGSADFENRYLAKDGSWHWLRWSSTLAPDESLIYARATDVTELKRIAAEREDLLAEVESLARSDSLTGLPNRRTLDEQLPRELARVRRSQSPLCIAFLDIDHFKAYNDERGHLVGDTILRNCAVAWDSELRGEDFIFRYGGDEFVVLLPDCPPEQASKIVERLREATPKGQTCSAGMVCWDFVETTDDLLQRADAALYRAKNEGRDRLVCEWTQSIAGNA